MADTGGNFEALQQQLAALQAQLDQQRIAQATAANATAPNAVNAVETLQRSLLSGCWPPRIGLR